MLHREYVPFIPIRCSKPEGPVDAPLFPPDKYTVPPGFWGESARECFSSARNIIDLVRTCQEWSALVETPIVGFAIYTVAFNGVYCINFPWMDPDGYMSTGASSPTHPNVSKPGESKGFEAARKALEMIGSMRPKLHMADGWFKTINRMHRYFRRLKSDYRKSSQAMESSSEGDSPVSTRHLSLREGGSGGGLDEFRLLERTLQEFGNLEDEDVEMADYQQNDSKPLDGVYDDSSAASEVKSEGPAERPNGVEPPKTEAGAWSAINSGPGAAPPSRQPSISTPVSQFRSYESYPQQHQHQHPTPPQTHPPQPAHPHGYNNPINNFRPAYSETAAGARSSLTSPASHSAAGTTPSHSHSQPSPPFERQSSHMSHHQPAVHPQNHHQPSNYQSWQPPNPAYPMQPPPPNPYTNGISHHQPHNHHHAPQHHSNSMQPTPLQSAYSSPGHAAGHQPQQPLHHGPPMSEPQQQSWAPMTKEAWLNSIDTRLGGDDVAAFVDGGEMHEWASMAASQGFGGGWLSTVWGGRGG